MVEVVVVTQQNKGVFCFSIDKYSSFLLFFFFFIYFDLETQNFNCFDTQSE